MKKSSKTATTGKGAGAEASAPGVPPVNEEDVQAAKQDQIPAPIGYLPGSAEQKMSLFNRVVEEKRDERVMSDNLAGVTSQPVTPMRKIQLKPSSAGAA